MITMLKMYVDSAQRDEVEPLLDTGLFHGVTTNPTLLERAEISLSNFGQLYRWATAAGAGEVFFQTWGTTSNEIVDNGKRLREIGDRVVVKVPATKFGQAAAATLAGQGVPVLLTAVYNATQVLPAIAAGCKYIAPYLGRMRDVGRDGDAEILAMQQVLNSHGEGTELLAASLRSVIDVLDLAKHGVSGFAIEPTVLAEMWQDEFTDEATRAFEAAARRAL